MTDDDLWEWTEPSVTLEDITDGEMLIDGRRVNEAAPKDRNLAMVFQNY